MTSNHEYKIIEDIEHAKYSNLYYINSQFYYFTTKNIDSINLKPIKTLGGPEHTRRIEEKNYIINPIIKYFPNIENLNEFVNNLNIEEVRDTTLHFSHYYDHNIAHGLYDALYPIVYAILDFSKKIQMKSLICL